MTDDHPLYGHRLVTVGGQTRLAYDYGRNPSGDPVACTGPGAVACPACRAPETAPCVDPDGFRAKQPHFQRTALMQEKINELRAASS